MSHRSRWEYFRAIYARYRQADRKLKQVILNEFCANTGYHRKYALRLLISGAFRLPSRHPNQASADFTTTSVVMRGRNLRSDT